MEIDDTTDQFRLHIDIPLGVSEAEARKVGESIISKIYAELRLQMDKGEIPQLQKRSLNYRLGFDSDRQRSNYFKLTDSGHVTHKKSRIVFEPRA
jgi:hypothetical protein